MSTHYKMPVLASTARWHLLTVFMLVILSGLIMQSSAFAMSEREQQIKKRGTLQVCIWPDYFSISYKNQKTGQLEGIDIDLSKAFAKDLGVEIEYVATNFDIFMEDIQQERCDIAMFGVGITQLVLRISTTVRLTWAVAITVSPVKPTLC